MTRDRRPRRDRRSRRARRSRRERSHPPPTEAESDAERARRVQRAYAAWARIYDRFAWATASVGGVRARCVRALDLDPGDTVVEFGCGPGVNFPALREVVGPTGRVVGVDLTGAMLDRASALVERRGWENVSLVRGDATEPPIRRADGVLATFVTSLFPDPYAVVSDWCDRADAVAIASFTPGGSPPANAALWAFARLNARLFDAESGDPLGQLAERTAAARRALDDRMTEVDRERYLFGTIAVHVGRDPVRERSR
ncbi:class I SAM-dependent methyltransferase [Halorubrum amylolyticum]|uniref:class I SAM-dependent methyltransferase n=1 Tax=Halorubrum amylolyticum TaxID=2508724 RepID=UPI001008698C|nr:class I SAM-dependent methyltransferase [Halorubrum amylolyticum]